MSTDHETYQTYTCSYPFEGGTWCVEVPARSREEAEARLVQIGTFGRVDGPVAMVIPAKVPTAGLCASLVCWWRNLWRQS